MSKDLQNLLYKIRNSITCSCLYSLEEEFNKCGLTLQTTTKNRMILCKIKDNRPYCKEFIHDYIFLGTAQEDKELSKRSIECIVEYVENAASGPAEIKQDIPKWQDGNIFYGKIVVVNEDVEAIAGDLMVD